MSSVRQSLQPELKSDHSFPKTYRLQAFCLRIMRTGIPEKGRSSSTQGNPTCWFEKCPTAFPSASSYWCPLDDAPGFACYTHWSSDRWVSFSAETSRILGISTQNISSEVISKIPSTKWGRLSLGILEPETARLPESIRQPTREKRKETKHQIDQIDKAASLTGSKEYLFFSEDLSALRTFRNTRS